jgi:glycerol-3-phosphate dehydrogenase (NAD(P)+)
LLSKGLEGKTFKFPFEVVKEVLPQNYYVIFGGPLMAEEISQGKGGVALVASTFPNFLKIKRIFGDCGIYFKHSSDFKGVSLAGVLKNIYTLFLEVSCEANLGLNLKGYFIAKILNEMEKICKLLNCNVRSIRYEAGLGDLIATSFSPYSRNRKFVQNLINNKKLNFKAEGFVSLKNILKIKEIKQNIKFLPILKSTYDLLVLKKEKYKVLENLWQKIK